jgi:hypothetical protein
MDTCRPVLPSSRVRIQASVPTGFLKVWRRRSCSEGEQLLSGLVSALAGSPAVAAGRPVSAAAKHPGRWFSPL